jgi:branched-chain amino acid transport system permease protein
VYLILLAVLLAAVGTQNLLSSRTGRAIRALRGGAVVAESFGANTFALRVQTFLVAALLACLAGWLYAHFVRFVNPTPFGLNIGIEFLFMAVVGGAGYVWGALLGATVITLLKDWLQDVLPALLGSERKLRDHRVRRAGRADAQFARRGLWPLVDRLVPAGAPHVFADTAPLPRRERPTPGEELLRVEGAVKQFGGLRAVSDVSFSLQAGEILGLIGPNGAGKSTMFNLVTGVSPATSGRVTFRGRDVTRLPARAVHRLGLGRTFQHVRLFPEMTLVENTMMGGYARTGAGVLRSMLHAERTEEASLQAEALRQLSRVGLRDDAFNLAGNLPLGKQRLLEIARALVADPVLLLLDEPAAGLRYHEKQELSALLRRLRDEGVTVLLVEHDMDLVMNLADRLVVMNYGEKLAEGTPVEVQAHAGVREAYLEVRHDGHGNRRGHGRGVRNGGGRGVRSAPAERHGSARELRQGRGAARHHLSVTPGSIVSVIGPNGAGKTTLLSAIMGVLTPRSGRVELEGQNLAEVPLEARVGRGMVMVPERRELFGSMTVEDNLSLGTYARYRRGERRFGADFDAVYARFPRLRERRRQLAGTLSGGEQQMLAIGRALMAKPRLLMLDEPSLGLAPIVVREILEILTGLRREGRGRCCSWEQNARAALRSATKGTCSKRARCVCTAPPPRSRTTRRSWRPTSAHGTRLGSETRGRRADASGLRASGWSRGSAPRRSTPRGQCVRAMGRPDFLRSYMRLSARRTRSGPHVASAG